MAKDTVGLNDEIDLIDLIRTIIKYKKTYIFFGLIGLFLSLVFTYQHEQQFSTNFKIHVGHPAFNATTLINSSIIQEKLNDSELNEEKLPRFTFNKNTNVFNIISTEEDVSEFINNFAVEALTKELNFLKDYAEKYLGFDDKPVIINQNDATNILLMNNKDIAKINTDDIAKNLTISLSETKAIYPAPLKHGLIGLFLSLLLAFFCMLILVLMPYLKSR